MSDLYSVEDNLTDEQKWVLIRAQRDGLLKASDFTQLPDVGMSSEMMVAWREYRQALRDLPDRFGNPDDVVFPVLAL